MTIHWSEIDPGPISEVERTRRTRRVLVDLRTELEAFERLNHSKNVTALWRRALGAEIQRHVEYLRARLAAEQNRPTKENP